MILFIDACMRKENSRTKSLCDHFLKNYSLIHPDEEIISVPVYDGNFAPLKNEDIKRRDALIQAQEWQNPMFEAAHLFAQADKIVIGAPYWDFSFPAALKCYIEHICVNGIAFEYTQTGVNPLCKAKAMLYITTGGGELTHANHGFTFMKDLFFSMFGVTKNECVMAQLLDVDGQDTSAILSAARIELDGVLRDF